MQLINKRSLQKGLAIALLVFVTNIPCHAAKNQEQSTATSTHSILGAPQELVSKSGLKTHWYFSNLPLGKATEISRIFFNNKQLYVLNNHNVLYAINGDNGTILWTKTLSKYHAPPAPVNFYEGSLLFVVGNRYLQVNATNGNTEHEFDFTFNATTSAHRNKERVVVGGEDKRFYSIRLTDKVPIWKAVLKNQPTGHISVADEKVYYVTNDKKNRNKLFVSDITEKQIIWQKTTIDNLIGTVVDTQQCFLPCFDTTLYCFETNQGTMLWKHLTGGRLEVLPTIKNEFVYQPVEHKALLCIDRADGALKWELKDGKSFLSQNNDMVYAITHDNQISVFDNKKAKRINSFYMPEIDLFAVNTENDIIYLATKSGNILALKPL